MTTYAPYILHQFIEPGSHTVPPPDMQGPRPVPSGPMNGVPHLQPTRSELYRTPETTPAPDTSSSFPPSSPYVVNRKIRGPSLHMRLSSQNSAGGETNREILSQLPPGPTTNESASVPGAGVEGGAISKGVVENLNGSVEDIHVLERQVVTEEIDTDAVDLGNGFTAMDEGSVRSVYIESGRETDNDEFYDPQDSLSVASNSDIADCAELPWRLSSSSGGEFYSAGEELSSGCTSPSSQGYSDQLRGARMSLLAEIARRKQAEDEVDSIRSQWQRLSHHLSHIGLTLPPLQSASASADGSANINNDPGADLCQQITVTRIVAGAVARDFTRAEVMAEVDALIATKNLEIARLSDKIQRYETMNDTMVQRNIEKTNQERSKRKRRKKWLWGSVSLAVIIGVATIAWSFLPSSQPSAKNEAHSDIVPAENTS